MAGKNNKNPLLSGAGINFPFENFTNNALLVPVSNNEPPLIPEEIEADSFLGQEPPSRSANFKPFVSSTSTLTKSSTSGFSETQGTHFPSDPQLPLPNPSPIPFTKSFTGASLLTKPTPVYADALSHPPVSIFTPQISQTPVIPPLNNDNLLQSPHRFEPPNQNIPLLPSSSLLFSGQDPYTPPAILTPALAPNNSPSVPTPSPTSEVSSYPPPNNPVSSTILTPTPPTSQVPLYNPTSIPTPTPTYQVPFYTASSTQNPISTSQVPFYSPPSIPPTNPLSQIHLYTPSSVPTPTLSSQIPFYTPPSIPTQTPSSQAPIYTASSIPTSSPTNLDSPFTPPLIPATSNTSFISHSSPSETISTPSSQTIFSYFSAPSSPPFPGSVEASPIAATPVSGPLQQSTEPLHSPPTGGQANSYRLGNIKRPTYTRPPDLPVTPMATMPPTLPTFTPTLPTATDTSPPTVSYRFADQASTSPTLLPPSFASLAQGTSYRQVYHHWFYKKVVEGKVLWQPFSMSDSLALEQAFTSATISPHTTVATDGGRYDVEVLRRRRQAVYWQEEHSEVRRCSWFVKGSMDIRYVPYEENVATMLEEEYRIASTTNEWNRHVPLPDGEVIVIHSPNAIAHHTRSVSPDVWGNSPQMQQKPRVVKRGMDEFDISEGEPEKVDHLLFLVHGIGQFCDLKFRPVTEVVDDFRNISLQLLQSHFKEAVEGAQAHRVEVLPVSWHDALHNEQIDKRLSNITLSSIPRLRHFTNDTLLDILFYTSPVFCETIVQAVGNELNRLYNLFLLRNPWFKGGVSLGGHSLGSLILFDMLCHQIPAPSPSTVITSPTTPTPDGQDDEEVRSLGCMRTQKAKLSRSISYVTIGTAGTGQPFISYPQLVFRPKAFFALGSPIGMFVTVRGIESLGEDFSLPTCPMFFNIFHPFDPVAYRVESLINSDFSKYSPLLIPHHKGRKRMHLELKDTLEHVGTALKQRLVESVKTTWNNLYQLAMFHRTDGIEQEVNKVIEKEILHTVGKEPVASDTPDNSPGPEVKMGQLNGGRRVDYVLQEAPLESFNEYLFALSSHVCYWESEDTMLMMLKEIYGTMGVSADTQVVQQILPFEMPDGAESSTQYVSLPAAPEGAGMDPTAPVSDNVHVGPPPTSGFIRK